MRPLLLGLAILSSLAAAQEPRVSGERVVLRTNFGDLVVALYADAAPNHAARFLDLVRSGAYDGAEIFKIDAARMIHVAGVGRRGAKSQRTGPETLTKLAPETGAAPHRYGTLTFARDPSDPDATGTSFAVMLAIVPAMDGRFTAFGRVEDGFEILETIRGVPVGPGGVPIERVAVERAFVRDAPAEGPPTRAWLVPLLVAGCGALLSGLGGRLSWRLAGSMGLLLVLCGFFLLFAAYAPWAGRSRWLGLGLLSAAVAVFRLMTFFERAA
ncbi:MAG: peptidylprolyl isomerase [Elusimicrobia bacterium]|nr:peptidylprolyl isomerase [Elusimicrobiota bacterium]